MTTYPLDKRSYLLFEGSASEVSYARERIILSIWRWIWTKWQILVLGDIYTMLPFYLILTRKPIIVKNLKVVVSWSVLFKVAFRCMFYYGFGKNHGDPYYEPTIMVHDSQFSSPIKMLSPWSTHCSSYYLPSLVAILWILFEAWYM